MEPQWSHRMQQMWLSSPECLLPCYQLPTPLQHQDKRPPADHLAVCMVFRSVSLKLNARSSCCRRWFSTTNCSIVIQSGHISTRPFAATNEKHNSPFAVMHWHVDNVWIRSCQLVPHANGIDLSVNRFTHHSWRGMHGFHSHMLQSPTTGAQLSQRKPTIAFCHVNYSLPLML